MQLYIMEHHGMQWNIMERNRISWNIIEYHGLSSWANTLGAPRHRFGQGDYPEAIWIYGFWAECCGRILEFMLSQSNRNALKHHGISWNILEYHGMQWNIVEYHGMLWNSMEYNGKPWNINDYHPG